MLNPKQEKFCFEYVASGNAASAYKAAYGVKSENAARVNGCKLLKNAAIQERLAEINAELVSEKIMTAQEESGYRQ